jgi:hypothetical protein
MSVGLSAVTAGTLAFTVAAPAAHANVITDLCNVLPGQNATAIGNLTGAQAHFAVTQGDLGTKLTDLNNASSAFVTAIVNHLQAIVGGTSTTLTGPALQAAQTDLVNKVVAWANADAANFAAEQAFESAQVNYNIINGLLSGLGCSV